VTSFRHRALVYEGDEAFLRTAMPFAQEGLVSGETVLVICTAGRGERLRDSLGGCAAAVDFYDSATWYAQPTRTIAAYSAFLRDHPHQRIRVVAEPARGCGSSFEVAEWTRYESLVNQAFAEVDASVLCVYDRHTTPPEIIDGALRTHPELVDGSGTSPNGAYLEPPMVFAEVDGEPLTAPPPDAVSAPVTGTDLSGLRTFLGLHARDHGLPPSRINDLLVAVTEIATNAVRHGLPPITCRLWPEDGHLVVEVTDAGRWIPDDAPGFMPVDLGTPGIGLWGVRMLCPLVQLRTGRPGTTVRLRVRA
jgi:anti-sigma regulatory factor (Ser/Thr protein kinase)